MKTILQATKQKLKYLKYRTIGWFFAINEIIPFCIGMALAMIVLIVVYYPPKTTDHLPFLVVPLLGLCLLTLFLGILYSTAYLSISVLYPEYRNTAMFHIVWSIVLIVSFSFIRQTMTTAPGVQFGNLLFLSNGWAVAYFCHWYFSRKGRSFS